MKSDLFFGIDIGTTYTKVVAVDASGKFIALAKRPTEWIYLANSRVEANSDKIFGLVVECIDEVVTLSKTVLQDVQVAGIGITGMAESGVVLGSDNQVLVEPIAWFDSRGESQMAQLGEEFRIEYQSKTGLVFKPESSLSSLLSVKSEGFDFKQRNIVWLNMLEYVAYLLTNTVATEPSLASRTALLDQSTLEVWDRGKQALGVSEGFIPEQRYSGQTWGEVNSTRVGSELQGAVVTVTGHDHSVGALGVGAVGVDELFNSAGTSDAIWRSVPGTLSDQQRFKLAELGVASGRHVLREASSLIGGSRGGLVLRRVLDLLGARTGEKLSEIDKSWDPTHRFKNVIDMSQVKSISNDVRITLTGDAGPSELWAAALDYMSGENMKVISGISAIVGVHKSALASGGWLILDSVRKVKRSVIPNLRFSNVVEPGAFGAAFIASWCAQGQVGALTDHVSARVLKLNSENRS